MMLTQGCSHKDAHAGMLTRGCSHRDAHTGMLTHCDETHSGDRLLFCFALFSFAARPHVAQSGLELIE